MMGEDETLKRVRSVHKSRGSRSLDSARRDYEARGRVQEKGRAQSSQARPKTKTETFCFPRPCLDRFGFFTLRSTDQGIVGEALPHDLRPWHQTAPHHSYPSEC